ncbi:hypothetical protein NQ317_015123 [Molorchus minor]|uniref:Family 31 glucosidase KIAA1161 n=1 Tax=Molorchus minor TaxID=1323400 RepID=A0ABQ9K7N4_9CUCU|nr:hypothetical protein NQ317_015123 [Molorchus minor]
MDYKKYRYNRVRRRFEEIPTIVVERPKSDEVPYVDEETKFIQGEDDDKEDNEQDEKDATKYSEENEIKSQIRRKESLGRRNSISLPNLDDMKVLSERVAEIEDYGKSGSNSEADDEEFRGITRNVRRKSVLSPRMLKPPGDEETGSNSPANSITSVNSLASLLREKIQPRRTSKKIKFNKVNRHMKIYNNEGVEIILAKLGVTINYDKVLSCLPADQRKDGSICLEWMHRARLYLSFYNLANDVKCYNLHWISLSDSLAPTDCFDMTSSHWYGGGQTAESAWPLEKGGHPFQPFITGKVDRNEWGNVLKRYFINSKGGAIIVDDNTPLYVSIESAKKKELCLRAQYDNFAYVNRLTPTPELNYSICTGPNMFQLHSQLSDHTLWDGLKKEDGNIIDSLLTEPLWEITSDSKETMTEAIISNFTDNITNSVAVLKQGHVLINEFWQNQIGDFELDTTRFPTLEKTMEMLKRRGFRVVVTIQPFISTESFNFAEAVRKRLLISERFSDRRIPALTRYKTLQSGGVLDITSNRTVPWLIEKLKKVIDKYKFDAYYLDMGTAYNMPHYYQCEKALVNPDRYKTLFVNSLQGSVPIFGVSSAIERPKSPAFAVLPHFESSWDGLRRVIPTILTYSILGYPFLIPGAVGGDYEAPETNFFNESEKVIPDQELYKRWLQLASFLPVVRYHNLPSSYGQQNITEMAKSLAKTRQNKVTPKLTKFARVSLNLGLPIIRPLWMLDSEDPNCHLVVDEFSIGDELIVAPILYPGSRQREVYLPAGVWKDGIDGSLRKGSRWIHDYKVEETEVAYFERLPDDTRF